MVPLNCLQRLEPLSLWAVMAGKGEVVVGFMTGTGSTAWKAAENTGLLVVVGGVDGDEG